MSGIATSIVRPIVRPIVRSIIGGSGDGEEADPVPEGAIFTPDGRPLKNEAGQFIVQP